MTSMDSDCEADTQVVEHFFGVYLLLSQNPKYPGRTYVGFTVDPERRLRQHNGGRDAGGAVRTSNRGPWAMVLIVHGFPNMISALRFEWAWQHPKRSRRLGHVAAKKSSEKSSAYHIRLLAEMLRVGPWCRLPLTVRWLRPDLKGDLDFHPDRLPPLHMPIAYGAVKSKKPKKAKEGEEEQQPTPVCHLCSHDVLHQDKAQCVFRQCHSVYHLVCLAQHFLKAASTNHMIPVDGQCPSCDSYILWGDIIRKRNGCYSDII